MKAMYQQLGTIFLHAVGLEYRSYNGVLDLLDVMFVYMFYVRACVYCSTLPIWVMSRIQELQWCARLVGCDVCLCVLCACCLT